jgi:putative alpha-1,2-mannosidase
MFLDRMFDEGHYIQHNQPDILTPYLYVYAGRHDKTVERVREILDREYKTTTSGLPGQDDAGCMSAWYVFSAMGFYPNAGQNLYLMSSPIFNEIKIDIGNGKTFKIIAENLSQDNIYIQEATLNGSEFNNAWFTHDDLLNNNELKLIMTNKSSGWGSAYVPTSASEILNKI